MKRIFLIICMLLMSNLVFAKDEISEYCPAEPYPINSKAADIISDITLTNFLSTKTIETFIQKQLKNELNSSFNIEVYPFSIGDLANGKFKKITVKSNKILAPDFALTDFFAESLCGYNRIVLEDSNIYFGENFLLGYETKITNEDISYTLLSPRYINTLNKIDLNLAGVSVFKLHDPKIEIRGGRVYLSIRAHCSNFLKNFDLGLSADMSLKVEDDKIVFSDIKLGNSYGITSDALLGVLNLLNPFNTKIKIDDHNTLTIKTKNLNIADDTILTNGIAIIEKNWYRD